jgi:ATP/maltotriose-dependent transcriptional regulator MalT
LIGRDAQLARLEAALGEATARALGVVLLLGEAGVGKTRLAAEFAAAHRDGTITLSARAYPLGATASLGLWVEALERRLRTYETEDVLDLCGGHVDDLAALLPSVQAASGTGSPSPPREPSRIRLLSALATLLSRLSDRAPIILTLDDVHLADGSSWEALNYLSRNLSDCRVLILLAARPFELADHRIAGEVVRGLEQEGLLTRLPVTPFSASDVRELAAELIEAPVPEGLVDWLVPRADGSPLFVTGLVRALLEEGADLACPGLRTLPEDLVERVHARLRGLDGGTRATLELMAVIGSRSELGDLLRLSGRSLDEMVAMLEGLQRHRLVTETADGRELLYEISHPLVQEAIYGQIGGARRRALHRHAARVLVEAGRYGAAASHVVQAADPGDEEAVSTLCEALRRAEAGEHHREALRLLEALLTMLPAGDLRWRRVVDIMPITPEWVADHRADVGAEVGVRAMRRADQVLERVGDVAHRAAVKFSLGSLLTWGMCELEAGRELLEAARSLFVEAGDSRAVLLATNELGYHLGMADDAAEHERLAREVLGQAEASADQFLQLQALCSLAWVLYLGGQPEASLVPIERGLAIAEQSDRLYRRSYLLAMRASARHLLGRGGYRDDLERARDLNPAYRDTLVCDFTAQIAWERGDLQAAVTVVADQLAWDGGVSTRRAFGVSLAVVSLAEMGRDAEAAQLQATLDEAFGGRACWILSRLAAWSRAVAAGVAPAGDRAAPDRGAAERAPADRAPADRAPADRAPAVRGAAGRASALEQLAEVTEDAVANGYWFWGRWMLADLAESAAVLRHERHAARACELLLGDPNPLASSAHEGLRSFVAGAAATLDRPGDAVESLQKAVDHFHQAGWRLLEGRALALLGAALGAIDRGRAIEALDQAAAIFNETSAVVRREEALCALGGLGAKGRRRRADLVGPASLSPREREVASLAAAGLSARQIAARLFIGERTVETHLANSYAKLGVTSKLELVRRSGEFGL